MVNWLVDAVESCCGAMERGQRRWLDAQEDACSNWLSPAFPLSRGDAERRFDGGLLAGAALWQAQADTQRELMLAAERLWVEMARSLQRQLPDDDAAPIAAMRRALELGCVSGAAMSTASRQAGHFAATRFSATPLKAARDVRKALTQR
ncbi:hypothetical protein [Chromobacterium alticapitis]|uniref:Uncharacterized protein n=1 Tax=Chromobacterium alticapitis TaxID=2073169 RepID=A0A2S5DEP4_9NEIS|nr:hypothetical protein [Chromobacterium alticapitis]POZ61573.1 hypothetical protein C2I19_12940 [Chromobacterium alticapitis]